MNCHELQRLVHAYLDYELDLMTSLDLEAHLNDCAACRSHHANLRAVRDAGTQHLAVRPAPPALRQRIAEKLGITGTSPSTLAMWRTTALAAIVSLAAVVAWLALPGERAGETRHAAGQAREKMVYHIASGTDVATALRNVANHLATSPNAQVVVVAHNNGVDFLLRGAKAPDGALYESSIAPLRVRGVDFRVCQNTLTRRHIGADKVIPEARLVPSGIAEISRLQSQEGYAYMKL
jgi:intracellular sulfur oxidation DsrE/DsrF family protein